jgi:hydrogenase maturation factor
MPDTIPLGKLPAELLASLLSRTPIRDPRVIVGPRPGEDAAVIDIGSHYLIAKTDPITFASDEIGWYAVNVNANDIATTGAIPAWFMATILLPGGLTTPAQVEAVFDQLQRACDSLNVTLVGGHTEVTYGIDRPIVNGVMLGLVEKDRLILTGGAKPGDAILVTKGVPVEATAIIARECSPQLKKHLDDSFIARCADYLHNPGISVVRDAQIAQQAGAVHAMHDPTEGGLSTGLWEMAEASSTRLIVDPAPAILDDGWRLCDLMGLDPLGAIASGALLMSVAAPDAPAITAALHAANIAAYQIGHVEAGPAAVLLANSQPLHRPARDEIARLFE